MFVTDEDYRVVIGEAALKVVSQTSVDIRAGAEREAMEEIAGYLRPVYDTEAAFKAEGDNERAIKWLEGVQAGKIIPALPVATDAATGEPSGTGVVWHSQKPLRHNW